ncbi:transposase [Streptomyces sp. NPDC006296]|uniref:transposase n=1 Tax=Streptomyces sp. NPDC006296 TaxID=3156746 RepID=UPI0033A0994C
MESKHTKRYTAEFKRDAIALVDSTGRTVTAVARELGISSESLRGWYRQAKAAPPGLTRPPCPCRMRPPDPTRCARSSLIRSDRYGRKNMAWRASLPQRPWDLHTTPHERMATKGQVRRIWCHRHAAIAGLYGTAGG